jgi:SAM-dependent methyltransferase
MILSGWAEVWRVLASRDIQASEEGAAEMVERWRKLAHRLDAGDGVAPDPLLEHILESVTPDLTVLDIGAGIGRWTLPLAGKARHVTAVEPLEGMRRVLGERVAARGIAHLEIVGVPWGRAEVAPHDVAIAAHATYATPDLLGFVEKMERSARQICYLALRLPAHDGVIGELSQTIHGLWHDSPNFIVGYNLLLSAGRYPNVLIERNPARYWTDPTIEAAMARARRHLRLADDRQDATIRDVLARRLLRIDQGFRWPDCMRSALIWWHPSGS